MTKRALILGVGGQDGSYLADILLSKGYAVHGLHRRSSVDNLTRIAHCRDQITLHQGDVCDGDSVRQVIYKVMPDEVYNEADQDSVGWSQVSPDYQYDVTFRSVGRLLETVDRLQRRGKQPEFFTRVFQPLSAHMFGDPSTLTAAVPQDETSRLDPQSPYGVAKAAAWHLCRMYRERHGVHVSCGILFNHDSPRRSEHYLLHKLCRAAVHIAAGKQRTVALGNLDGRVDVGYAKDYMEAAWLMLQQEQPFDAVIATGEALTVRQLFVCALLEAGATEWNSVEELVTRDPEHFQESPPSWFQGDASRMRALGWQPRTSVRELIAMLVRHFQEQP